METTFTPITSLAGGLLIGIAAATLLLLTGRIAGISGIVGGLVRPAPGEASWRVAFLAGMLLGSIVLQLVRPASFGASPASAGTLALAGLLVGFGTRLGNGCTSGHGVCGISRLSPRALVATAVFMVTAAITVFAIRHLGGAA